MRPRITQKMRDQREAELKAVREQRAEQLLKLVRAGDSLKFESIANGYSLRDGSEWPGEVVDILKRSRRIRNDDTQGRWVYQSPEDERRRDAEQEERYAAKRSARLARWRAAVRATKTDDELDAVLIDIGGEYASTGLDG